MDILIYCHDTETPSQPVDGVLVRLYRGGIFITSGTTGSGVNGPGEVLLTVPAADSYVGRFSMSAPGYEIVSPQAVVVTEDGDAFSILVELFQHEVSADARYCCASGFVELPFHRPLRQGVLSFEPLDAPQTSGGAHIVDRTITAETNADGFLSVHLLRNRQYRVRIETDDTAHDVIVPDRSWTDIGELLYPVPVAVTFDPVSLALAVHGSGTVEPEVLTSDGTLRALSELVAAITFVSDPAGLLLYQQGDLLVVEAPTAGSYQVLPALPTEVVDQVDPAPAAPTGSLAVVVA